MRTEVVLEVRARVLQRHQVLLEQRVHLKTCVHLQESANLSLGQGARAIALNRDGFKRTPASRLSPVDFGPTGVRMRYRTLHLVTPGAYYACMIERPFWQQRIDEAWREAPIVWLSGVRRAGKTTLARSLGDRAMYVNCDLPAVEDMIRDPPAFYRSCEKPVVVFDEVHQLRDPARLLKIGADEFPTLRILATGSSTLSASRKFRDTLTGRKRMVHLLPVLLDELPAFGQPALERRLLHGGLPPVLLAETKKPSLYREWLDSFFARDIQRLFGFRDVNRFNAFFEYCLRQSGGQFEQTKAAGAVGITRPTVESHLRALEVTHAVTIVRPFHGNGQNEIVRQPKVYGFDTGFVSWARGWEPLRPEDSGALWEHLVLESLQAKFTDDPIRYWRDKRGLEVDFVRSRKRGEVDAIECKWSSRAFDGAALKVFRNAYPEGRNYLVTPGADRPYQKRFDGLELTICTPRGIPS